MAKSVNHPDLVNEDRKLVIIYTFFFVLTLLVLVGWSDEQRSDHDTLPCPAPPLVLPSGVQPIGLTSHPMVEVVQAS